MGSTHFRKTYQDHCTILKCLQPNIRCQHLLTPNIELEFLVELTGIEPVASWLQTRRSPS